VSANSGGSSAVARLVLHAFLVASAGK
jgi:hypothetical protein